MTQPQENIQKICTQCKIEKPLCEYTTLSHGKYGRASSCKACYRAYQNRVNQLKKKGEFKSMKFHDDKKMAETRTEEYRRLNGIGIDKKLCQQFLNVTPTGNYSNGFYSITNTHNTWGNFL